MVRKRVESRSSSPDSGAIRAAAVALLARRDYLTAGLQQRLQSQGFDPADAAAVIAELAAERLLEDERFVERFVASRAERGQGPARIAMDLRSQGAPEALIEAAIRDGPDWGAVAREVRRRKFGPESPGSWPEKARQARFLQYRGFSSDHIRAATGADFEDSRT